MKKTPFMLSLTLRFTLTIFITAILLSLFAAFINDWRIEEAFRQERTRRLNAFSDTLFETIKEPLAGRRISDIDKIALSMIHQEKIIDELMIVICGRGENYCLKGIGHIVFNLLSEKDVGVMELPFEINDHKGRWLPKISTHGRRRGLSSQTLSKSTIPQTYQFLKKAYRTWSGDPKTRIFIFIGYRPLSILESERARLLSDFAATIASGLSEALSNFNYTTVKYTGEHIAKNNPDIEHIQILNQNMQLIFDSRDKDASGRHISDKSIQKAFESGHRRTIVVAEKGQGFKKKLDIMAIIKSGDEPLGELRLQYSLKNIYIEDFKRRVLISILWSIFAGIAIGICYAIALRLAEPINKLSKIARNIGRGELDAPIEISTHALEVYNLVESFKEMIKGLKERDIVKNTFSRYVTKQVAEEILKDPDKIVLGGRKQEVTALFSDIRGFTSLAEKMPPEKVVALLNEYLTAMVDIVFANEGTLDKFIGDAVMAVFGVPVSQGDDVYRAVKTGLEMQEQVKELNSKWVAEGNPPLKIGIGINTGEVIAGNIGSVQRMEYTVIGDNVNLASRIETLTKEYDCPVLISESTWQKVCDRVESARIEGVSVKGKSSSVNVYQVFNYIDLADTTEKRRYRRKAVQVSLNFRCAGRDFHIPPSSAPVGQDFHIPPKTDGFSTGVMQNISGGGLCFLSRQPVSENENIEINFELDSIKYYDIIGRVVECSVRDGVWDSGLGARDRLVNGDCSVRAAARNNDEDCSIPERVQVSNLNPQKN